MPSWAFLNTDFVPDAELCLPARDLAFQRAYGIFDFFRLANGRPVFVEDHLQRFYSNAAEMRLPVPFDKEQMAAVLDELIARNQSRNTGIRISLTGGVSDDGISIGRPNLVITEHSFLPVPEEKLKKGIKLLTIEHQRQLPHVKTIDYIMPLWLQPLLDEKATDDILYRHLGKISECPRSNFFLVTRENQIVTAGNNILKGVTRNRILKLAAPHFEIQERDIFLGEIKMAKEAFITSTTKKLLPVRAVDDVEFEVREEGVCFELWRLLEEEMERGE